MMRTLTALTVLAASAALAGTASADESVVRVTLTGLSPAAAYAKIESAAKTVCTPSSYSIYSVYLSSACVAGTVEATLAKIAEPALTQYSQAHTYCLVDSN